MNEDTFKTEVHYFLLNGESEHKNLKLRDIIILTKLKISFVEKKEQTSKSNCQLTWGLLALTFK